MIKPTRKGTVLDDHRFFPDHVKNIVGAILKYQSSKLQPYEKNDIFGKIMKNGAFFVFTPCSESL